MSKAFTKEDDQAPPPVVVPQRAMLPAGVPNYVTPRGLGALRAELAALEGGGERLRPEVLAGRRADLEARIAGAVVVDPHAAPADEVRFGARVGVRTAAGLSRSYQIVGVDEADAAAGRIAFVAPLARALLGRRVGDSATLRTPRGEEELQVVGIDVDVDPGA